MAFRSGLADRVATGAGDVADEEAGVGDTEQPARDMPRTKVRAATVIGRKMVFFMMLSSWSDSYSGGAKIRLGSVVGELGVGVDNRLTPV